MGIVCTVIPACGQRRKLFVKIIGCCCAVVGFTAWGQELHSTFFARNSHLWRGQEVSAGLVSTGNLQLEGKRFYGGLWAGGSASGSYKELDHYVGYRDVSGHIKVEFWDIYNFSPNATYNNREYFNYTASETGRFWDFRSYYTISKQFPLELSWNCVLFGRDRNKDNTANKYSYFASLEYPLYKRDALEVRGRVGYADALYPRGERGNFFSRGNGINEVSVMVSKKYAVGNWEIPLGLWAMWNPVDNHAFLQFSIQLFSF